MFNIAANRRDANTAVFSCVQLLSLMSAHLSSSSQGSKWTQGHVFVLAVLCFVLALVLAPS